MGTAEFLCRHLARDALGSILPIRDPKGDDVPERESTNRVHANADTQITQIFVANLKKGSFSLIDFLLVLPFCIYPIFAIPSTIARWRRSLNLS